MLLPSVVVASAVNDHLYAAALQNLKLVCAVSSLSPFRIGLPVSDVAAQPFVIKSVVGQTLNTFYKRPRGTSPSFCLDISL
eukprot:scaffold6774_cov91-Cylindrotheca_fusiformis.AAC.3